MPAMQEFGHLVRSVAGFPKPGIVFRDVTPLLADAHAFAECIEAMARPWQNQRVEVVCGIDARGFIFGAALARRLDAGFLPSRKAGKLPPPVVAASYQLEYGSDRLEASAGALNPGQRVLIVDDVLATGGTLSAACELVEQLGGELVGASVVIELKALRGRDRWTSDQPLESLLVY